MTVTLRYREARDLLDAAQKPGAGVPAYMRWVNRRGARRLAAGAHALGLTPDAVTGLSLVASIAGMAVLLVAPVSLWSGVGAAVLFALAFLLDSADGQVARLSARSSRAGEWLDHVADAFRTPAMHAVVAVAATLHGLSPALAVCALGVGVLLGGQFMSQILAEQLLRDRGRRRQHPQDSGDLQSWLLLPTDPGIWAWVFVLWGAPGAFLTAYLVLAALNTVHAGLSLRRRHRELREADTCPA